MNAIIKTYRPTLRIKSNTFFIQSRGLHSGRPLKKPIPNCFAITLSNQKEYELYFALVEGLFQNKAFHHHIIGSVIPMIRIDDLKQVVRTGFEVIEKSQEKFQKMVKIVSTIDKSIEVLEQRIALMKELKSAHLQEQFKRRI